MSGKRGGGGFIDDEREGARGTSLFVADNIWNRD